MESAGKRHRRLKKNLDFVTFPSDDESEQSETEDMIPSNSPSPYSSTEKDPIAIEMDICDSSSGPNFTDHNDHVAYQIQKLNNVDQEEYMYRKSHYKVANVVLRKRLHCTICDQHVGCHYGQSFEHLQHPLLKVLCCSQCVIKYKKMEFPLSIDKRDRYCRWCTSPGNEISPLRYCSSCPFAFCEDCIYYNLYMNESMMKDVWLCIACNVKELWPLRGLFWALVTQTNFNKSRTENDKYKGDISQCCLGLFNSEDSIMKEKNIKTKNADAETIVTEFNKTNDVDNVHPGKSKLQIEKTRYRPLPASKMSSKCFRTKTKKMCSILENLMNNLHRVADSVPDIDDKFSIKSKIISLTSLLNIGANQLKNTSQELQSMWEKLEEDKRRTLCDTKDEKKEASIKNIESKNETTETSEKPRTSPAIYKSKIEKMFKLFCKTKPCSVKLTKLKL